MEYFYLFIFFSPCNHEKSAPVSHIPVAERTFSRLRDLIITIYKGTAWKSPGAHRKCVHPRGAQNKRCQ